MSARVLLLLCLGVFAAAQDAADPVKVTVYFETLCPDSINFFVSQMTPAWAVLKDIMEVDDYAYGFATSYPTPGEGYTFECQHGPDECKGNIVVDCAKKYITDVDKFVDFTNCLMTSSYPPDAGQQCAVAVGEDWTTIDQCATSVEGQTLHYEVGVKQDSLIPVPDWMPWIIINDVYSDANLAAAQSDLIGLVCSTYEGDPPLACM